MSYKKINQWLRVIMPAIFLLLFGCQNTQSPPIATLAPTATQASPTTVSETSVTPVENESADVSNDQISQSSFIGLTYQQLDGNRYVLGSGSLPNANIVDIPLAGTPLWVVAIPSPSGQGSIWVVTLANGQVQAFQIDDTVSEIAMASLPPEMPPILQLGGDDLRLINSEIPETSPLTHPIPIFDQRIASIQTDNTLIIWQEEEMIAKFQLNALPDGRILQDEMGRLLLLTDATQRYRHAVLGDAIEAGSVTLLDTNPNPQVAQTIMIPEPRVIEGIAPIWADLTGDGKREIIVTLSDAQQGAQLVVFNEQGEQVATGPAIGQGNRWRHQLAVAPFGPNGELELVDVLTPHLGRVVEFFQLKGDKLELQATVRAGYTSHTIGSRNLDLAVAGDFDGDEKVELVLPSSNGLELGAVRRSADGADVVWTLELDGRVTTNLMTTQHGDIGLALGVGQANGVLRLWLPQ